MLDQVAVVLPADCAPTQRQLHHFRCVVDLIYELLEELRGAHQEGRDLSDPNAAWIRYGCLWSFQLEGHAHRIVVLHGLDEVVVREDAVAQLCP